MLSDFLAALAALGTEKPELISTDPADLTTYGTDWTRVYAPAPLAIAFPRTTEEVAQVIRLCNRYRVALVPSGGRTGLAGGAVAAKGELVLSLRKMNRMDPVDLLALTVRVQAGAITEAVHKHVETEGLLWPIDLAAKGSCQIGGNIATNAGGVKVIRYGLTRQWVLGLQVVTGAGDILELNGALEKNNTGYDLRQLFIGSEGTLGVITEATLKLTRRPAGLDVFLLALEDVPAVLRLFQAARHERGTLTITAYEFLTRRCMDLVCAHRGLRDPLSGAPCYVLLEVERPETDPSGQAAQRWLEDVVTSELVLDGVLASSERQARELWALREGISESLSKAGLPHKNDIALPVSALSPFCAELDPLFAARYPDLGVYLFGHIGDGNLHVNVLKPTEMPKEDFLRRVKGVDKDLFALVARYGGSVSAEHGIGLLKKEALPFSRTETEQALFRGIKAIFDPQGILNPGKIFDS